jgi:hypothetical protein
VQEQQNKRRRLTGDSSNFVDRKLGVITGNVPNGEEEPLIGVTVKLIDLRKSLPQRTRQVPWCQQGQ